MSFVGGFSRWSEGERSEEVVGNEMRGWGRGWLCYEMVCGYGGEPFLCWKTDKERGLERVYRV